MPEKASVGDNVPFFKKINVGVGSKPTLLCNHARKGIRRGRRPAPNKVRIQQFDFAD